jgi:two-component system sensor histidine kinase YesM
MKLISFFRNLKLKYKLLLFNSTLIIVTLGILSYISYQESSKTLNAEVLYSTKQVFSQTDSFLSYKLNKIIDVSDALALDSNLNETLSRDESTYELPEQIKDFQNISLNLSSFQNNDDIYRIRLFIPDYLLYSSEEVNFYPISKFIQSPLYETLLKHKGKMKWITDSETIPEIKNEEFKSIHSIRFIKNFNLLDDHIGVLGIDIREDVLQEIVTRANTSQNGIAYLQNSEGAIIASSNAQLVNKWLMDRDTAKQISGQIDPWKQLTIKGENVLAGVKSIDGTDWTLISIVPLEEVYSASTKVRDQIILFMVILAIAANLFGYWFSSSITNRIGVVVRKMRKVQSGELDTVKVAASHDEIGELVENFNYMVNKMKVFIEEQYKLGLDAKSSELKALQSQINPHFLYNTLDLINWTAIQHNVPEISTLVQSLSQFYKLSLNKGDEMISIENELEHVRIYVDIQNRRFGNAISLSMDVDESLYDCNILKITLQPIVENSILHGIRETANRQGEIFIYTYREDTDIVLCVQDNGVGMSEELVELFNNGNTSSKADGYGIKNINHRIKLYYGEQYGLHFESRIGEGTTVEVRIPAEMGQ